MAKGRRGVTQNAVVPSDKWNLHIGERRRHSKAGGLTKQPGGVIKIYYVCVVLSIDGYPHWQTLTEDSGWTEELG